MRKKEDKRSSYLGLKIIVLLLFAALAGAAVLGRMHVVHGEKRQGEKCRSTEDCAQGFICYSYQGSPQMCYASCHKRDCPPGLTCVSIGEEKGRRSMRMRNLCVPHVVGSSSRD